MRRWMTAAAASLTGGLPVLWCSSSLRDGGDTLNNDPSCSLSIPRAPTDARNASSAWSVVRSFGEATASTQCLAFALGFLPGFTTAAAEAPQPTPRLETAYRASLIQPLLSYMPEAAAGRPGQSLTASNLQALEATAVAGFTGGGDLPQVVTIAWALAWAGHEPGKQYLELLQAAAAGSLPGGASTQRLGAAHRAVLLWCAVMHGAAPTAIWESGLRAVTAAAAPGAKGLDECALLYLLHAALLYGADGASPGRRTAASAGSIGAVSPTSPAAASAASPACQPRATREEVLAAAPPLGRKALDKLASAYGEYVPLHPAIEGPYLALLYVLEQLAVSGSGGGGGADQWEPPGVHEQAATILSNPKELARIKRELLYHWRGDQLLDEVQGVRNQVVYLLTRRMGLTVSQPEDVDVAVPSRWLAIYVRGGGGAAAASAASASAAGGAAGAASLQELKVAAGDALEVLQRERFAPQVQGGRSGVCPGTGGTGSDGMWAARVRQLRRLGWRVVVVDVGAWRGLPSDTEREAYLLHVLRGRA